MRSGVPTPGVYGQFSRGLLTVTFRHHEGYIFEDQPARLPGGHHQNRAMRLDH